MQPVPEELTGESWGRLFNDILIDDDDDDDACCWDFEGNLYILKPTPPPPRPPKEEDVAAVLCVTGLRDYYETLDNEPPLYSARKCSGGCCRMLSVEKSDSINQKRPAARTTWFNSSSFERMKAINLSCKPKLTILSKAIIMFYKFPFKIEWRNKQANIERVINNYGRLMRVINMNGERAAADKWAFLLRYESIFSL